MKRRSREPRYSTYGSRNGTRCWVSCLPLTRAVALVGVSRPTISRMAVDLPAPLGPGKSMAWPGVWPGLCSKAMNGYATPPGPVGHNHGWSVVPRYQSAEPIVSRGPTAMAVGFSSFISGLYHGAPQNFGITHSI